MTFINGNKLVCIPEYIGQDLNMNFIFGKCRCGHGVTSYENYCSQCGTELDWEFVKEELNSQGFNF